MRGRRLTQIKTTSRALRPTGIRKSSGLRRTPGIVIKRCVALGLTCLPANSAGRPHRNCGQSRRRGSRTAPSGRRRIERGIETAWPRRVPSIERPWNDMDRPGTNFPMAPPIVGPGMTREPMPWLRTALCKDGSRASGKNNRENNDSAECFHFPH